MEGSVVTVRKCKHCWDQFQQLPRRQRARGVRLAWCDRWLSKGARHAWFLSAIFPVPEPHFPLIRPSNWKSPRHQVWLLSVKKDFAPEISSSSLQQ